jgi:peroxiredoxin
VTTLTQLLEPGTPAPDFTLHVTPDQKLSLSELRGRPVILAFYPADWSPVCGDQMALYNEVLPEFKKHNAELLGISVDGVWCHKAFAKDRRLHFPLLADFEPKGAVAKAYGAYRDGDGVCERALFGERTVIPVLPRLLSSWAGPLPSTQEPAHGTPQRPQSLPHVAATHPATECKRPIDRRILST